MARLTSVVLSLAFFALGACADAGCTASAAAELTPCVSGAIRYTSAPINADPVRVVPVLIDRNFSLHERARILRAVNEWNHVLNGHIRLDISSESFDAANAPAAASRREGWIVAKIDSRNPILDHPAMRRTLAVTVGTRKAVIYIVTDRLVSRDLGGIMMHEIGHALGAGHNSGSALMHPYYSGDKQRCIDKGAVRAVSVAQNLPLDRLNWCGGDAVMSPLAIS